MLRIARNAPIVEPMTAIHVFSETCSAGTAGGAAEVAGAVGPAAVADPAGMAGAVGPVGVLGAYALRSAASASVVSDSKAGKGSIDADAFAFTSLALGEGNGLASGRRTGVNIGLDGHAGPKLPDQVLTRIEADLHGDSLNDLREVSSGVVGR